MWPTHWAPIPQHHYPLVIPTAWGSTVCVCVTGVFRGEGTSVRPLPVFLSGKIQQCFFSMPGNTFQETTKEGREGKTLISTQQLKADKQSRAQRKSTEPFCGPQLQSSKRHAFLTPFASKGAAPAFIQALSSAQRSEQWSTKWWSRRGHVWGTFICAFLIQSTNSRRWVQWCVKMWCAYNPLGLSDTEIKYCSIEMGGWRW